MPTTVKIRRSGTASATPSALEHGEIAINYADGKVFWKNASDVITSFTFQSYALASHTHAASDITSGTLDIARIPTGSSSSTVCIGNDSRLSDTRTPTDNTVSTAKLQNDAVTYAKIQNVSATNRILGRSSAGAGDVEELDAATARTVLSVQPTASPAFTGTTIVDNPSATVGTDSLVVRNSGITNTTQTCGMRFRLNNTDTGAIRTVLTNAQTGASDIIFLTSSNPDGGVALSTRLTISSTGTATFAGQILADDLTTSNSVVYGFDGDTNTGVGRGGADILTFVTNGTERVRVDASGNVGIGAAAGSGIALDLYNATGGGLPALRIRDSAVDFRLYTSNAAVVSAISNHPLSFHTNNSEKMVLGTDGSLKAPDVYSDTVGATNRDLFIDSTGLIGYVSSIRESKTDIATLDDVSWLSALSPVAYRYRKRNANGTYSDEADGVTDYGLIAEDVEAVRPELCFYDDVDGEPQLRGVTYSKLITPMLRYIQQLEQRIAALEERING